MSKATEQNDKLKRAIIISAVLHIILFAVLIWSSFDEHIEASAGGGAKGNGQPSKDSGTSGANGGATGADISAYAKQIQVAIQSRLYDASLYQGKQCVLHISLAPDGSLKSITSEGGDPALCQAALMAAKTAKIPKPPSQAVYEKIKDAKLDFKL